MCNDNFIDASVDYYVRYGALVRSKEVSLNDVDTYFV